MMGTWADFVDDKYRPMLECAADAAIDDNVPQVVEAGDDTYCVFPDAWIRKRGYEPEPEWPRLKALDGTIVYVFLAAKAVYGQGKGDPHLRHLPRWRLIDGKVQVYKPPASRI